MRETMTAQGWVPSTIWIERGVEESLVAQRVLAAAPDVPARIVEDPSAAEPADLAEGKRRLVLRRQRGTFLQYCPAGSSGMVCCNYLIMNFAANCPFDCTYCFLQDYVANNPTVKAFTNVADGLAEIGGVLRAHPRRTFRVGTGELADSLALDHLTGLSLHLVPFFAEQSNAILELKTKSDGIENLLGLDPKDRTVISWSVNTPTIMAAEEPGTASLQQRIEAALRVQAAGYKIGFHFDPLIAHEGWEAGYRDTIAAIFRRIDTRRVAWVSVGSLRMTPRLKAAIRARRRQGHVLTGELVPQPDGKERLWRGLRVKMYRRMLNWLRQVDGEMPLYICMEPASVWQKVFGEAPADRDLAERLAAGKR